MSFAGAIQWDRQPKNAVTDVMGGWRGLSPIMEAEILLKAAVGAMEWRRHGAGGIHYTDK